MHHNSHSFVRLLEISTTKRTQKIIKPPKKRKGSHKTKTIKEKTDGRFRVGLTDSEKPVVIGAQQNPAASFFKQLWLQCFSGPEMRNNCNEREPSVFLQLATGRKILKKLKQIRFGKKRETKPKLKISLSLSLHNLWRRIDS